MSPASEGKILNHWTTREASRSELFNRRPRVACRAVLCLIGCVSNTAYPFFLGTKIKAPLCAGLFKALRGSAVSKDRSPGLEVYFLLGWRKLG